ncbi:MAG: hypothetical protein ACLU3I_05275 [Acutalibacteraceae bacterium]
MLIELRENDRIIGSNRPESAAYAKQIYEKVVTGGTIRLTDDLTAEMCKLTENTFRDINIAYANELGKRLRPARHRRVQAHRAGQLPSARERAYSRRRCRRPLHRGRPVVHPREV